MYEIIERYKETETEEGKEVIFKSFCEEIWRCENKRKTTVKAVKFKVRKDLLKTDLGQIFDMWSEIEYTGYKSMTKETDWCSLIRQKINNIYTLYFDKEVVLNRDYKNLLETPKRLYYRWIDGEEMYTDTVTEIIDDAIDGSIKLKAQHQKEKMDLSWNDYKKVIEEQLLKIINRCRLAEEYCKNTKIYDMRNEDCLYISYFCKSIEGEMMKWQKRYYGVREHKKYKRCKICGALIENTGNKKMYCTPCAKENERKNAAIRKQRWLEKQKERNEKT